MPRRIVGGKSARRASIGQLAGVAVHTVALAFAGLALAACATPPRQAEQRPSFHAGQLWLHADSNGDCYLGGDELLAHFRAHDRDADGILAGAELGSAACGENIGQGMASYEWMHDVIFIPPPDNIPLAMQRRAFVVADADADGRISTGEFRKFLQECGFDPDPALEWCGHCKK